MAKIAAGVVKTLMYLGVFAMKKGELEQWVREMQEESRQMGEQIRNLTRDNHELQRQVRQAENLPQRTVAALEKIADCIETITGQMDKSGIMVNVCTSWANGEIFPIHVQQVTAEEVKTAKDNAV